ncbi:uncharacterized protein LOC129581481 [Paramacrobiotus metropolitanus]|uniref:uncharacterized protein LOC129581481 n=1 Tax=Paramacrobiotus metropolitanus TaxID=2943436 RepID=UPI0024465B6C|nr:uncharacterized protein LOC129581481 [Paramacrobiotus metropolitanus]XP_055328563.1 uncharacterized protein LOC129581481 [Paramacrobiotus metropolitanus]XP_055328564.1 uncharacterized protein LOC129581481 [Paramacrobiotus metropolitanus]XP_055328565.1 uncharacterized protein LOC129581481 [Paramacrobiotus metropolitanus]XP_055328566.1 uncharacterized protein LOC129581481 [Paramacrobiotus metropolitanus]
MVGVHAFFGRVDKDDEKPATTGFDAHMTPEDKSRFDAALDRLQGDVQKDSAYNSPGGSEKAGAGKSHRLGGSTPKTLAASLSKGLSAFEFPESSGLRQTLTARKTPQQEYNELMEEITATQLTGQYQDSDLMDITVTHVHAWNAFWIRTCKVGMKERLDGLLEYMERILSIWCTGSGEPTLKSAAGGEYVLVNNGNALGRMCRAEVIATLPNDIVRVLLVDYGISQNLSLAGHIIYPFPSDTDVIDCPGLAKRARMPEIDYGFFPHDPKEFENVFNRAVNDYALRGIIQRYSTDGFAEINLEYRKPDVSWFKDLGRKLSMMGFQRPKLAPVSRKNNKYFDVAAGTYTTWTLRAVGNAAVMYLWPSDASPFLDLLKETLRDVMARVPNVVGTIPQEKDLVGVCFNGDWYRARIQSVHVESCDCLLLDLGKVVLGVRFEDIRPICEEHLFKIPALAMECCDAEVANMLGDAFINCSDIEKDRQLAALTGGAYSMLSPFMESTLQVEVLEVVYEGEVDQQGWVDNDYAMVTLYLQKNGNDRPSRYSEALSKLLPGISSQKRTESRLDGIAV